MLVVVGIDGVSDCSPVWKRQTSVVLWIDNNPVRHGGGVGDSDALWLKSGFEPAASPQTHSVFLHILSLGEPGMANPPPPPPLPRHDQSDFFRTKN